MTYENISVNNKEGVCTIQIEREAKMNALNRATLQEIKQAVLTAESDQWINGIILRGAGEKAFAAGADIAEFANFSVAEGEKMSRDGHAVMNALEQCSKPTIAAVFGFALGGGCELAMACHFRIAAENAKFGQPEVNLGVPPGYGGTQRLAQLIGKSRAMELLLTTDVLRADKALQYGLVNDVKPAEEVIAACETMIQKMAAKSPDAIAKVIACVNAQFTEGENGMETEIKAFGAAFGTADFKEGTVAFLEKRKAAFKRE